MFVQTEVTPNPNSLKFLPGKTVSNIGSIEINSKDETNNDLIRNLLSACIFQISLGLYFRDPILSFDFE